MSNSFTVRCAFLKLRWEGIKKQIDVYKRQVSNWVKESNDNYNGWHMIKVEETDKDAILKDKKAKDSIYSAIENANSDLASKYISEAMKKLDVTYGNDAVSYTHLSALFMKSLIV